jgi:hypothetical protein
LEFFFQAEFLWVAWV